MAPRPQSRDWEAARQIYETRILPEQHIADLCYGGSVHAARARLYKLRGQMFKRGPSVTRPDPKTGEAAVTRLWEIERWVHAALANADRAERKYPEPLADPQLHHLLDTSDLYVALALRFREDPVPGMYDDDWYWLREPHCHRRFEGRVKRHTLAPDAEVRVLDEIFLIERQTGRSKKAPEILHNKTFLYHGYENSLERTRDEPRGRGDVPVPLILLWACDAERDRQVVLRAAKDHPTKTLRELDMNDHDGRRVEVIAASPEDAVETIHRSALNQAADLRQVS